MAIIFFFPSLISTALHCNFAEGAATAAYTSVKDALCSKLSIDLLRPPLHASLLSAS